MAWRSHGRTNAELVRNLKGKKNHFYRLCYRINNKRITANGIIKSETVYEAMEMTDRAKYSKNNPYTDAPQGIGYGVTISAPHMHAHALELLKSHLTNGSKALDVGCGSGYLTVCMALMCGDTGKAVGIDHIPELIEFATKNIRNDRPELLDSGRIKLIGE